MSMTIQKLAEELGVTRQAIYQRCKLNNLNIDELTEKTPDGKKILTGEGETIVRNIYSKKRQVSIKSRLQGKENENSKLTESIKELTQTINELRKDAEEYRRRISDLEKDKDFLRQQVNTESANVDRLMKIVDNLTEKQKTTGFIGWLRRLGSGSKQPDQDGGGAPAPADQKQDG